MHRCVRRRRVGGLQRSHCPGVGRRNRAPPGSCVWQRVLRRCYAHACLWASHNTQTKLAGHGGKIYSCALFGNGRRAVRGHHLVQQLSHPRRPMTPMLTICVVSGDWRHRQTDQDLGPIKARPMYDHANYSGGDYCCASHPFLCMSHQVFAPSTARRSSTLWPPRLRARWLCLVTRCEHSCPVVSISAAPHH